MLNYVTKFAKKDIRKKIPKIDPCGTLEKTGNEQVSKMCTEDCRSER
jgi:hypothetical protein